eukprot:UN20549
MSFVCFLRFCSLQKIEVMFFGHFVACKINQNSRFLRIFSRKIEYFISIIEKFPHIFLYLFTYFYM